MSNRLDQLFKDKLAGHAITPSPQAWDRVGRALVKKNNAPIYLRLAAALLLLATFTAILVWLTSEKSLPNSTPLSHKTEVKPKPKEITVVEPVIQQKTRQKVATKKKLTPAVKKQIEIKPLMEQNNPVAVVTPVLESVQPVAVEENKTSIELPKPEQAIVLEYRLAPVATPPVETAVAETKKSGLSRVIDFALDAKNGDSHLGELRQAKDELFALNFKKDKQNNHK